MPLMPKPAPRPGPPGGPGAPRPAKSGLELQMKDLFRTPVWHVDLPPAEAKKMNAAMMAETERLLTPRPNLPPGANWQTDPVLQDLPAFKDLMDVTLRIGGKIVEFLELKQGDLVMTGAWANVNPPGGRNSNHTHPNNYLSAVYYVSIPEGEGRITFEDPRPQAYVMMPPVERFGPYTSNTVNYPVQPGRLVFFPSWLTHSVPMNRSGKERVSIAMNLMFRDYVEASSPALWKGTVPVER
jgi:uncharacterized protein (TIGR02466 family)